IALHGDQHGGGARGRRSGGGCRNAGEEEGHGFDGQHLTAQYCVATLGGGDDFVGGACQKFVDGCGGQALLDAVGGSFIFNGRDGDHVNSFWKRIVASGDVIAASGKKGCCEQ